MMYKACNSTADSDFVKDMRGKYKRPIAISILLVPTVNSSVYKTISRFHKDYYGVQKTQGKLCRGIYAISMFADNLNELKKINP